MEVPRVGDVLFPDSPTPTTVVKIENGIVYADSGDGSYQASIPAGIFDFVDIPIESAK